MTNKDTNDLLYEKANSEQEKYRDWLLKQPSEEILRHCYEYTIREDILYSLENNTLTDKQASALLDSEDVISDIYKEYDKYESDRMYEILSCIESRANTLASTAEPEKEETLKILFFEPGKEPETKIIGSGLSDLQEQVGGYIQAVYPFDDSAVLICNEEGKLLNLPLNRSLKDDEGNIYDIVSGNFLIAGVGDEDFCSLTDEQITKYSDMFHTPETFIKFNGEILSVPQDELGKIPLYEKSFSEALESDELSVFRLSARADNMCKTAIEAAITDNYSDNTLNVEGAKSIVDIYGMDRVKKILALTAIAKELDGRMSPENKAWAKSVRPDDTKENIDPYLIVDKVNPGLVDLFISCIRKDERDRKPSVKDKLHSSKENSPAPSSAPKKKKEQEL